MKNYVLRLCLSLFFGVRLFGYQWPVEQKAVIATFGQPFAGTYHNGIDIAGAGQEVKPIEAGTVIFYHVEKRDERSLPSGLGSFILLQHEKKLRTLYGHTALSEDIITDKRAEISELETMGRVDESGFSEGAHLHLSTIDTESNQVVNPYLLLPPLEERTRPTVRGVVLKNKDKQVSVAEVAGITDGTWSVFAEIYDQSSSVRYFRPMAPYKIVVYLNGQETFKATFDALKEKDGVLRLYPVPDLPFSDLYDNSFTMKLGTVQLSRGLANLEIFVKDFQGNERIQSFQFRVN